MQPSHFAIRTTQNMTPAGTTQYVHDLAGHLIAESDGSGNTLTEYVWLDDMPLALVANVDTSPTLYFVHADHLNRPIKMTDGSENVVWDAVYNPFGDVNVITGSASNNMRFPGQYFLIEDGLHYNWSRHYDPTLGRYVESDPIGLAGGINTYAYVDGNPLSYFDSFGLDVTVRVYPGQGGNPGGHIGIQVNSNPNVGFDPASNASTIGTIIGRDVPGVMDKIDPNRKPEDSVTIHTTPNQDKSIQDFLDRKTSSPGNYNTYRNNCTTTVHDALGAGNINSPDTMWPRDSIRGIK